MIWKDKSPTLLIQDILIDKFSNASVADETVSYSLS